MLHAIQKHLRSLFLIAIAVLVLALPTKAQAQCASPGQCVNNKYCVCISQCGTLNEVLVPGGGDCGSAELGTVVAPKGVLQFNLAAGSYSSIGIFGFVSVLVRIITILAGLWTVANFILGGVRFISAFGDTKAYTEVKDNIQWSMVGLVVIVAAYLITALVGLLFFGDATFLLNPKLQGAVPQ